METWHRGGVGFRQGTRLSGLGHFLAGWTPRPPGLSQPRPRRRLEGDCQASGGEMRCFGLETHAEGEPPSKQCERQGSLQALKRADKKQHKLLASPFVDTKPVRVSGAVGPGPEHGLNQACPGCWHESLSNDVVCLGMDVCFVLPRCGLLPLKPRFI